MVVCFRVNNEFFGVCHRWGADPLNADVDPEVLDGLPLAILLPKEIEDREFLHHHGFKKGDPVELTLDDRRGITAIRKPGNAEFLWERTA